VERALTLFVRALGGPGVRVERAPSEAIRSFAADGTWFFPAEIASGGRRAFFAAAAHLAAHARFGGPPFARGNLRAISMVLVSLLEDARVEHLVGRELPGLASLFGSLHTVSPADLPTFPALAARIARALADEAYVDPHPLVAKARAFFASSGDAPSREECRVFASRLGNDIGQMRLPFNERTYAVEPSYRDDNRLLWEPETDEPHELEDRAAAAPQAAAPAAGDASADQDVASTVARYPEWDYLIRRARPDFCTVREVSNLPLAATSVPAVRGPPRMARALKIEASRRTRHFDGESLDLEAAIEARVDLLRGATAEGRVYVRTSVRRPDAAVLLLLDLSASTADVIPGGDERVIDVIRESARVLALSLESAGQLIAVHGFSSNGRHDVSYRCFKRFDQPWNFEVDGRLAAASPGLSTRMGAALRHAAQYLAPLRRDRRLLLLLTDGEPSDIDVPDPAYLAHDAARAVRDILQQGIHVFGIDVDPAARVRRIFGDGRFRVVHRIERLPELLVSLLGRIT
jgi:hypothetical protein